MALKRISVVVLICFVSFADAEICADGDAEQAKRACGEKELCITINGKNATSPYKYSKKMSITVECHYNGAVKKEILEDFTIKLKKQQDIINRTKCRNLNTVIHLSPRTSNVHYTCEKHDESAFDVAPRIEVIKFIYDPKESTSTARPTASSTPRPTTRPTQRTTTRPTQRTTQRITQRTTPKPAISPSSKPPDKTIGYYSVLATIKVTVNGDTMGEVKSMSISTLYNIAEADYYYFNHEMVNVTCALVISDHNPKSYYLLEAPNNKTCIDGNNNGTQISYTQELTASMAALNYRCSLIIGDKAEDETCAKIEKRAVFTLQFKFAKLMMYIDNDIKEKETTENGNEIVYTYNQEYITIEVKCSHADAVYNLRHISHPAIIWETKQLDSTYKDNPITYHKNLNIIKIPLFADQSNSYLDCVEHLGNQVSYQPTRIRLRFIYAKLRMYIDNNNVTEEQKTENGIEVVYKYKKENVTVVANCSHGAEVYRIHRYNMSHTPIKWITEMLDITYKSNEKNTTLIEENSIQIRLFADQNESFVDCEDNLSITSDQNSKIRLKFIYEKDTEDKSMSNPKDAEPNEELEQKDAKPHKERDQKDVKPHKERYQKDAEAMSTCDLKDAERVKVCGQKELCITIDNKIVTSYNYSQQMDILVECHYNRRYREVITENFTIHWKNGDDVISNEEKCRNLEKVIHLSPDTNKTVYTCEKYSNSPFEIRNKTEDITFLYVPEENLALSERFKSFFESNWIVLTAGLVLCIVVIAVIVAVWVVLKSRKSPKEDKRRLNPKGSRESLEDIPKQHKETRTEPKLNEQYTNLNADTVSEVYSDPYSAMYTQPIPKNVRKTKVLPKLPPKPKPRNVENYSNTSGLVYEEPSTYNNINCNTRRIAKNTGATYNNIDKSYKNTGVTYNNISKSSKHTGATYNNIDKSLKNTQHVHFYDNMAASYSNTENEKCSSDVYSEPGLYEEPS